MQQARGRRSTIQFAAAKKRMRQAQLEVSERRRLALISGIMEPDVVVTPKRTRKPFSKAEIARIIRVRTVLITKGLTDGEISGVLTGKINGRRSDVITDKINALIRSGRLVENPNKRGHEFSEQEIAGIVSKRKKLMKKGFTDHEIARLLETDLRPACSLVEKIDALVAKGELEKNPNKRERRNFTDEEYEHIVLRRKELMLNGLTDRAISIVLEGEMAGRSHGTIKNYIGMLVSIGVLDKNLNKGRKRHLTSPEQAMAA